MPQNQAPKGNKFSTSNELGPFLASRNLSLAFSSYDDGHLYVVGSAKGDDVSIGFRKYDRAMGLAYRDKTLYLAANNAIIELENDGQTSEPYDVTFVPRRSAFINSVDCHEIGLTASGPIFANTSYSCIAKTSQTKSFAPIYTPSFISKLVPEDRCHLNGMGLNDNSELSLISFCNQSDSLQGWRSNRTNGGQIIEVQTGKVLKDNLSMPHSPRWHSKDLAYLDSGRGFLVAGEQSIFCPGFLRGLAFDNEYAFVTVSLPRDGIFKGLELQDNLKARGGEPWCGILIINLIKGAIEHWLRIEGETRELFDVITLPGIKCPNLMGPNDPMLPNRVTIEQA